MPRSVPDRKELDYQYDDLDLATVEAVLIVARRERSIAQGMLAASRECVRITGSDADAKQCVYYRNAIGYLNWVVSRLEKRVSYLCRDQ